MNKPVLFLGAGASASFGIPTMQEMVRDFASLLNKEGSAGERALYGHIREFLKSNLDRPLDLEVFFEVADSIRDFSVDRIGVAAAYHSHRYGPTNKERLKGSKLKLRIPRYEKNEIEAATTLRRRLENHVIEKCGIREDKVELIDRAYSIFFSSLYESTRELTGLFDDYDTPSWIIFTTNYDAVLEHFWCDTVGAFLDTGFEVDPSCKMNVWSAYRSDHFDDPLCRSRVVLYKLHGSITWFLNDEYGLTEQRIDPREMKTSSGTKFQGRAILYPTAYKGVFVDPYLHMYKQLNERIQKSSDWIVVGFSFGDSIIRDIFVGSSTKESKMILLDPNSRQIARNRLGGFEGRIIPIPARFGEGNQKAVCRRVIKALGQ